MRKRSIGLTILGWFEIVVGFFGSGFFLFFLLFSLAYVESYGSLDRDFLFVFIIFSPPAVLLLSLLFLGIGVLKLKKWAWIMSIFLYPVVHIYICDSFLAS